MIIETALGDITAEDVDAIVNAANGRLARGAGVCGAIFSAAGPELDRACEALGGCATGDAKATAGFALRARWIVHTVGPVWHGGGAAESEALASCYRRCIEVARDVGARSIAFPAISTGIYGFPKQAAAEIAVRTLRALDAAGDAAPVERARLVAFDRETLALYEAALSSPAA